MNRYIYFKLLTITIPLLFFILHPRFGFEAEAFNTPILSEIQNYLDAENFEAVIEIANDSGFLSSISNYPCYEKGKIFHLIGTAYYFVNQEQNAIIFFKRAVFEEWKNCLETPLDEVANSIYNIGVAYQYTDQIIRGKSYIDSALLIIETIDAYPKANLAFKYQGAGSYFSDIRDFTRSEAYLKNAIKLSNNVDQIDAFYMHIDLLSLYLKFKKYTKADDLIQKINSDYLEVKNELGNGDIAIFHLNSAEAYLRQNNYLLAESTCRKALQLLTTEDVNLLSNANEILGVIYYKTKNYDKSKYHYEQAYRLRLAEEDIVAANIAKSFSLENLAELDLANKAYTHALDKVNNAILLNSPAMKFDAQQNPILNKFEIGNGYHLLRQLLLKEKIIFSKYELVKSKDLILECLSIHNKIDTLVDNVLSHAFLDQSKLELLDNMANHSSRAVDVCLILYEQEQNRIYLDKAFYFSSRAKSIVLQKLVNSNYHLANSINDSLTNEYLKLKDILNDVQKKMLQPASNKDSLTNEFALIQLKFDQFNTHYFGQTSEPNSEATKQITTLEIQAKLSANQLLYDIFQGDKKVTLFAISKNEIFYHQIDLDEAIPQVNDVKTSCNSANKPYDSMMAKRLFSQLFSFLPESFFDKKDALFIIPDGAFHGLPFEALIDGQDAFLVQNWEIAYGYVSTMIFKERQLQNYGYEFTGLATAYSSQLSEHLSQKGFTDNETNLGNLARAEEELRVSNEAYNGHVFYNQDATIENFNKYALTSKIVYLSMHGIVDMEDGARSALVFDDRKKDFLLRAYELHRQPMQADLVVLSACHTADGKLHFGEGINGISRAFLASGVNSIISSIWSASEGSSLKILPSFLKKNKNGIPKRMALQQAKKEYLQSSIPNLKHPFYWANYILITGAEEVQADDFISTYIVLGLCGVLFVFILLMYWRKARMS